MMSHLFKGLLNLKVPSLRLWFRLALLCLLVMAGMVLNACENEVLDEPIATEAPPTYTGPQYLRGSIGSLTRVQGYDPLLVSSFGLVVNLSGDTGSIGVPAYLRQRMVNYARRMGLGSAQFDTQDMPPEQVLADPRTAVVKVSGLIPPGASEGQRFDILVEALPRTETTSLVGGTLWTTEMGIDGASPSVPFVRTLAVGRGPIYTSPFNEGDADAQQNMKLKRQAVIIGGGTVSEPRRLRLMLNQPSWFRSRIIADRINERFPAPPGSTWETAEALTDVWISLNVPPRFQDDPTEFLNLISHIYLQGGEGFEVRQTQRLANVLRNNPNATLDVALAWKAMGRVALPTLQEFYGADNREVRLAALDAGAWLNDSATLPHLSMMAQSRDAALRVEAARMLGYVVRDQRAEQTLVKLMDDGNINVRLAAYNALRKDKQSRVIERFKVSNPLGVKFMIDRVPLTDFPMIYVSQDRMPRIAIFGPGMSFPEPTVARMWNNRLMLRYPTQDGGMKVFYQPRGQTTPQILDIVPTVETLAYTLGHGPTAEDPQSGMNLSYGQIVDVLYQLGEQGFVNAPIKVEPNALISMVEEQRESGGVKRRPEFTQPQTVPDAIGPGLNNAPQSEEDAEPLPDPVAPAPVEQVEQVEQVEPGEAHSEMPEGEQPINVPDEPDEPTLQDSGGRSEF